MIISETSIRNHLYNAGFRGNALNQAINIARCESGFNTTAHNLTSVEDSRGIMQINIASNANPQYATWDLFDPAINAVAAYQIFINRGNFSDWTCAHLINPSNTDFPIIIFASLIFYGLYLLVSD